MVDGYHKIAADLMLLERWQYITFAAACAERVALVFRSFGSPKSQALYEEGLELIWLGITREYLISQAKRLRKKIEKTPEAKEDPAIFTYHYAARALIILSCALEAVERNEVQPAIWTCSEALQFRDGLDYLLTEESQRIESFLLNDPPPPGPLEVLELKHQRQTLELITSVREPNAELINSLRQSSRDANKDLEFAISEIRKGRR